MSTRHHPLPESADTFADRIKILIHRVGSVTEIARMCRFSEGVVRSWRDGHTDPSRARCVTLARTMGISLVWLVAGEGAMQVDPLALAPADGQGSSEPAPSSHRHRSRLHTAAATLQTSGMVVDAARLDATLKILQSELDTGPSQLTLAENADLLIELYGILGPDGHAADAQAMADFLHRLAERTGQRRSAVA